MSDLNTLTFKMGTEGYQAPEIVMDENKKQLKDMHQSKCDSWSMGVLIFELLLQRRFLKFKQLENVEEKQHFNLVEYKTKVEKSL